MESLNHELNHWNLGDGSVSTMATARLPSSQTYNGQGHGRVIMFGGMIGAKNGHPSFVITCGANCVQLGGEVVRRGVDVEPNLRN